MFSKVSFYFPLIPNFFTNVLWTPSSHSYCIEIVIISSMDLSRFLSDLFGFFLSFQYFNSFGFDSAYLQLSVCVHSVTRSVLAHSDQEDQKRESDPWTGVPATMKGHVKASYSP